MTQIGSMRRCSAGSWTRPGMLGGICGALLLLPALFLTSPALARTATPTSALPVATVTPTRPPQPRASVSPNPVRSGQRVTLDASATTTVVMPHWLQLSGDVALAIEDADSLVASFVAPPVSTATVVRVRFELRPFGEASSVDFDITILPVDTIGVTVDGVAGSPGEVVDFDVRIDPYGLAVDILRHEVGFAPEAAVIDRGDGTPDCEPYPGLGVQSAGFEFLPAGCVGTDSCSAVRAQIVTAAPITDPVPVYRCRIALTAEPADSCAHVLRCVGGDASGPSGSSLALDCRDGQARSEFPQSEPTFSLRVEPAVPAVGETVALTFSVAGNGGIPQYQLYGTWPFLDGETILRSNTFGDVTFSLRAARAGSVQLQLGVNYETTGGCPGNNVFFFRNAASELFPLTIRDPHGVRVSGRVAEFPAGCEGAMRGVTVTLEPGGFSAVTDLVAGEFAFAGISPGDYALNVVPSCNPFGCWPQYDVHVAAEDVSLSVCPQAGECVGACRGCVGDCNGDRRVSIDELVAGVAAALGEPESLACAAIDVDASGLVRIDELISAVRAALDGCGGEPGVTPTPTALTPTVTSTPVPTPTSCRAVLPLVAPLPSSTTALAQTIYLCGIYYASSLVNVEGPTGEPIALYEVTDCPLQCTDSRQQCRAADVPLLPNAHNTIRVCQVPGIGCGPLPDLCAEVEIEQRSSGGAQGHR